MGDIPRKLTKDEAKTVREQFLVSFGKNVRDTRERLNVQQTELAGALGLPGAALSYYENGIRDMRISNLPLISFYCKTKMQELLPVDQKALLESFKGNIGLLALKYHRDEETRVKTKDMMLTAKVYMDHGKEVIKKVTHREKKESPEEQYRKCKIMPKGKPFSDGEFVEYAMTNNPTMANLITPIYEFEIHMDSKKRQVRSSFPEFILDELIIDAVVKNPHDEKAQRAYAYYYNKYKEIYDSGLLREECERESSEDDESDEPAETKGDDYEQMNLFDLLSQIDVDNKDE